MMRYRHLLRLMIAFLIVSAFEVPAFAGGGGLGLFAAILGLSVVANSSYGWYDPYYADPYYPPYYYPPPYAYETVPYNNVPYNTGYSAPAYEPSAASPPPSQPVLRENERPALPNMTPLPGEPLPPNAVPRLDLVKVNEKLASVRALLDKKAASGDITSAQRDSEATYLTQIERVAQAQASAQKGLLSSDQEEALLRELTRANSLITQNFAVL